MGVNPLAPRLPHFAAKAKHVIHIFANGGPSHVDTFDPKPSILKYAASPCRRNTAHRTQDRRALSFSVQVSQVCQSGIEVSELFEKTAAHIDDMCIIRSMHADVPNHEPSLLLMNCGEPRQVRPSMGSWLTYGLGTDNQKLASLYRNVSWRLSDPESQNCKPVSCPVSFKVLTSIPSMSRSTN